MEASTKDQTKAVVKPSIFSLISPQRNEPKEMNYFNTKSKVSQVPFFDRMYGNIEERRLEIHEERLDYFLLAPYFLPKPIKLRRVAHRARRGPDLWLC